MASQFDCDEVGPPVRKKKDDDVEFEYWPGDSENEVEIEAEVPVREAALKYKIPRATLQFRRSSKFKKKTSLGPTPYLTSEEELLLVDYIIHCSNKGSPRRKVDTQLTVKSFLDKTPRNTHFRNNSPSEAWYKSFLMRHPIITERTPEGVTAASSNISESDIRKWFNDIKSYIISKNRVGVLNDPSKLFNANETCFNLCPKTSTVLAPRGAKNVYEIEHASPKHKSVIHIFS
nr:unnamed protein product [Callosobruchus analis]